MKKNYLLYILLLIAPFCIAQNQTGILNNLKYSINSGDITEAINSLEDFESSYQSNFLVYYTNYLLSDLYFTKGQKAKAQEKRLHILEFKPTDFSVPIAEESYKFLMDSLYYPTLKATVCIKISEMYMDLNERDSSIKYLNLADDKFLPFKDCGNGILMYKSFLSFKFTNHYLKFRDTTSAINRLLHYFLETDGDALKVTNRLKELLLARYTQKEIKTEIDKAIVASRLIKTDSGSKYIQFVLFGETLHTYFSNKQSKKRQLKMNRFISILSS